MNNKFLLVLISILCCAALLSGCKKDKEAATDNAAATDTAKEADKAADAKEADKADKAVDVKSAVKKLSDFNANALKVIADAGDDCDKIAAGLNDLLKTAGSDYAAAYKIVDSAEGADAESIKADVMALEKDLADDGVFMTTLNKCAESTPAIVEFAKGFDSLTKSK